MQRIDHGLVITLHRLIVTRGLHAQIATQFAAGKNRQRDRGRDAIHERFIIQESIKAQALKT